MSTFTAVGVRLDLDGPPPVAPPHSLLKTPGVVVDGDSEGRWMNGVVLDVYPENTPVGWDPCSAGTFRTKDEGENRSLPTWDPFVIYLPATCSYFSSARLEEMTSAVFDATQSFGVEHVLAYGIAGMGNAFLGDGSLVQLGTDGISVSEGLARLENAIGGTGRQGLIHATPATVSALDQSDKLDGEDEGNLLTVNGNRVVSGGGYIGVHPNGKTAPSSGKDWMFATGPVEVRLGPVNIEDVRTSLDRSDNTITFRAERAVLAEWDVVLQVGVLVDWTL